MKFECDKSLLSAAIDGVSRAITNRAAIPVLEGIYLKAEGFQLTLTGYDMEMGITTNIECNVQVPGETVLEAKLFGSMVSRMPSGTVSVELNNEGMAIISGGVAEFEIPAMNASDYPSLPNTAAENTMTIPTSMMRELIEKTIYAVAVEDKKPAHTGELFVIEPGRLTVVALDGYRLAIIKRDVECTRDIRIIIPAKTLQELLKITGVPEVLVCFLCYCALESTAGMWASSYCTLVRGLDAQTAASWASLFYLGITAGRFVSGFLTMKMSDRNMIRLGQVLIALGILLVLLPAGNNVLFVGLILIGLGCAPVYPCIIHETPVNFGRELSMSMTGLQMAFAYVGSCLAPPLFGLLAQNVTPRLYPWYLAVGLVVMVIMSESLHAKKAAERR